MAVRAVTCEGPWYPWPQTLLLCPGETLDLNPVTVSFNSSLVSHHFYERTHADSLVLVEAGEQASGLAGGLLTR